MGIRGTLLRVLLAVVAGAAQAQAQSSGTTLDPIYVEGSQGGAAGRGGQGESAYGPVQGYSAGRSATGTKTDTPLAETPQSVTVIGEPQIKDQGIKTVQEALRYTPGVYADAFGPDSRGDYPKVRGSDPNIFLDGTQAVNAWKFNEWRPDPYTLSRIEVLRGPSSVLYGAASTAGIINMVSKLPQAESFGEIGVQYGSFDRKQVQADVTGKLSQDGQWLYRLIAVARASGYQTDFVPDDRVLVQPAVTWKPTNDTTWTVLGFYQRDNSGSSTQFLPHEGSLFPGPNGRVPVNRFVSQPGFDAYRTETASVSSLFEHRFSEAFRVRQSTRYMHTDGVYRSAYPNTYFDDGVTFLPGGFPFTDASRQSIQRLLWSATSQRESLTSDTHGELKFVTGPISHKLIVGSDYRTLTDNGFQGSGVDPIPFNLYAPVYNPVVFPDLLPYAGTRQRQLGVYAQDQMRMGPLIAVAGTRHDTLKSDTEFEPRQTDHAQSSRFGLMYELPGGITPYVSWAQSFDPIFGANGCVTGTCTPKRGELKEVGVKVNPWNGLAVNAALYDIEERNRQTYNNGDPLGRATQIGKARIRGGELEVIGSLTPDLDIIGAYSYTDARIVAGDLEGSRIDSVPLHQASLWGKYRFTAFGIPGFTVGAGARYVGESWATGTSPYTGNLETLTTPHYVLFDAMLGFENRHWRFQVNAMNLFDKAHVTTCLINGRGDCFYGQSRTILSSLTYKF